MEAAASEAQVRVVTLEEFKAAALEQGISVDELSAFTREDTIYVRLNESLRLSGQQRMS